MKRLIRNIGNWFNNFWDRFDKDRLSDELRNFEKLEPVKYLKTLEFATIYEDNRLAIEFLKREASAFFKLKEYLARTDWEDEFLDQVFEVANLSPKQTWQQSFEKGEIHWQTALTSFEEPDFIYRVKVMEQQLFRRKPRLGKTA